MQTNDIQGELKQLLNEHQELDDEADQLSARRFLAPDEQHRLKVLKVKRLAAREKLDRFLQLHKLTKKDMVT